MLFEVHVKRTDVYRGAFLVESATYEAAAVRKAVELALGRSGWDGLFTRDDEDGEYEGCDTEVEEVRSEGAYGIPRYDLTRTASGFRLIERDA